MQYKNPGDSFSGRALWELLSHALLYLSREKESTSRGVSLWCLASKFTKDFDARLRELSGTLSPVMEGVDCGEIAGFTLYRVDLSRIPDEPGFETLFPAASRGQARRFLKSHILRAKRYSRYLRPLLMLHPELKSEESPMVKLTREEMLELDVPGNVELWTSLLGEKAALELMGGVEKAIGVFGLEKVLEVAGLEKILEVAGPEKAIDVLGPEKAIDALVRQQGLPRLQELLARRAEREDGKSKRSPSNRKASPRTGGPKRGPRRRPK